MKLVIESIEVVTFANLKRVPMDALTINRIYEAADAAKTYIARRKQANDGVGYAVIAEEIAAAEAGLRAWVELTDPIIRRLKAEDERNEPDGDHGYDSDDEKMPF